MAMYLIVNTVEAILVLIPNIMSIVILQLMKELQATTRIFLTNLSISNTVFGCMYLLRCIFHIWPVLNAEVCLILAVMGIVSCGTYFTTMSFIFLDIYLCAKQKTNIRSITRKSALIMVMVCWAFWIGFGAVGLFFPNPEWKFQSIQSCTSVLRTYNQVYIVLFCSLGILSCILLCMAYIPISKIISKQMSSLKLISQQLDTEPGQDNSVNQRKKAVHAFSRSLEKYQKALNITPILTIIFVVARFPSAVFTIVLNVCDSCYMNAPAEVAFIIQFLLIFNLTSNAVIYLIRNPEFRKVAKHLFTCAYCRNRPDEPPSRDQELKAIS